MPLIRIVDKSGNEGFKWGENGICYYGEGSKEKALKQGSIQENLKRNHHIKDVEHTTMDVIDSVESDHDLLIRLDVGISQIKESMITREDVHKIVSQRIETHCETRHVKMGRNPPSWESIIKWLVASIPIEIGALFAYLGLN